ncbi:MAG: hypothetical protein AAB221_06545 [Bacteroidota bacterium]
MKNFGLFISLIICLAMYAIAYGVDHRVFYNGKSLEFNAIGILLFWGLLHIILLPMFYKKQFLIKIIFIGITVLVLNLVLSLLVDFFARLRNYELETNDMSFVIIIPFTFIVALIFGLLFDMNVKRHLKKDAMKTGRTSE